MALNYVTLTIDLFDGAGSHLNGGTATFTPSVQLTDATDHEIITQAPVTAALKPTGSPAVLLLATDNGNVAPSGWAWTVTFTGVPGNPASFSFFLPFSGGSSQNLSAISPVSTAVTQYPSWPGTTLGDTVYGGASPAGVPVRLPGNTTTTREFLRQQGTGSASAAPAWDTVQVTDLVAAAGTGPATSVNAPLLYGAVWGRKYQFYADSYGALGNGRAVTDMVMTTGAATTLACTSSSPFVSGDVGKAVLVSTAKGAYAPLRAAISGFTDSAHVTLNASATSNTTGTPGAIGWFGTDDTAALQSQLNAAYAYVQAHGHAEFLLDPSLIYIADGAFLTSASGNAQITLPVASQTATCGELVLDGGGGAAPLMHWLQLAPETAGGAVIASTRTDGTATGGGSNGPSWIIGGPVNGYGGEPGTYSNILIRVKGMGTLSPYNATQGGLGLFGILEADIESYSHMTGAVVPSSTAPSPTIGSASNISNQWAYGLQMPSAGNQVVCRVGQFRCEGMCYGIGLSEWSHLQDGHSMYCIGAVGLYSGNGVSMAHHAVVDHMQAENCINAIIAVDGGNKRIRASIGTESISGTNHVYDPSNLIYGDVDFWPQNGNGSSVNFANGGGLNLRMRNMMTSPGTLGPPAVPGSTTAYTNYYGRNARVYITSGGAAVSAITVTPPGGSPITTGATLGTTGTVAVDVPIAYSITLTYASTAPTWVWAGD